MKALQQNLLAKRPYFFLQFCLIKRLMIAASCGDIDEKSTVIPRIFPLCPSRAPSMKQMKPTRKT